MSAVTSSFIIDRAIEMYASQEFTLPEIAQELNLDVATIHRYVNKAGIGNRGQTPLSIARTQGRRRENSIHRFGSVAQQPYASEYFGREDISKIPAYQQSYKLAWKCQDCEWKWEALPKNRTNGSGCPRCAKTRWTDNPYLYTGWNIGHQESVYDLPNDQCWVWTGHISIAGYGQAHFGGKIAKAHVFVYNLMAEECGLPVLQKGQHLRHHVDMPILNSLCVNPYHLMPGTARENSNDKYGYVLALEEENVELKRRVKGLEEALSAFQNH